MTMTGIMPFLAAIGGLVVLLFARRTAQFLAFHILTPAEPLKKYKRPGTDACALVTGSSAGIGLGIAQELVRQGFGVVLLGHLPDELASAAASLRKIHPSCRDSLVRTLVLDARNATPDEIEAAVQSLSDLNITILVNNVGGNPVAPPTYRTLDTYTCADVDAVIDLNARFMARLTALMLPLLSRPAKLTPPTHHQPQANKEDHRSLILTLSSGAQIGIPYLTLYGATKAFNLSLAVGLARELEAATPTISNSATVPIDSITILPGEVHSQSNAHALPAHTPTWSQFGRDVVHKVDGAVARGWRVTRPDWRHDVERLLMGLVPEGVVTKGVVGRIRKKMEVWKRVEGKSR